MIPRSQGHCYLQYLHSHHHCPVWPGTGGNPRCCPGPQGLDPHCSRNRRLASQGWHKSRGWRHRCHPPRWARATCGMAAGWPACPLGNPLSISVTRRSRPLEAGGPPCWPGRACGDMPHLLDDLFSNLPRNQEAQQKAYRLYRARLQASPISGTRHIVLNNA